MKTTVLVIIGFICFTAQAAPFLATYKTRQYFIPRTKGLHRTARTADFMDQAPKTSYLGVNTLIPGKTDISYLVSLPENQGSCGSCWDFSLTKSLRSAFMTQGQDPGALAFNYLLNNCGNGPKQNGCGGGDFDAAGQFENNQGPWLEAQDPYQSARKCKTLAPAATAISYTMLGSTHSSPTFKDLAYAVGVQSLMVSIDTATSGDWSNYDSGIYNDCKGGPNQIDHMIDLVGYDCETSVDAFGMCVFDDQGKPINGDGYLITENNWGESWGTKAANGHGGYMMTRMYDSKGNHCNAVATNALIYTVPPHM